MSGIYEQDRMNQADFSYPKGAGFRSRTECAYYSHSSPATRMAVVADDRVSTGETRYPLCRNHRASEQRGFIRWEPLYERPAATVKRATLFDGVIDTFQTEAELNGFRAEQGALL